MNNLNEILEKTLELDLSNKPDEALVSAFKVLNRLFEDGWAITMKGSELIPEIKDAGGWDVKLECKAQARGRIKVSGETLPYTICQAAIMAEKKWA